LRCCNPPTGIAAVLEILKCIAQVMRDHPCRGRFRALHGFAFHSEYGIAKEANAMNRHLDTHAVSGDHQSRVDP